MAAYQTVTLTGTYQTPNRTAHKGHVEIIPSERVIKDTTGDIILTGRVKVDLIEKTWQSVDPDTGDPLFDGNGDPVMESGGFFSVALPATDDPTLNPTGFGYTIAAKLHSSHPPAVSFSLPASLGATTVEDLTPVDPSTFAPTTTYAESAEVAALDSRVTTELATKANSADLATVATTGNYTDLTGQPAIPTTAADVGALPDTTTPADLGAEPAGLSTTTQNNLAATYARTTVPGLTGDLSRWHRKVRKAHRSQTAVGVFGHSVVAGAYANETGEWISDTDDFRHYSLTGQLRARFGKHFAKDPGVGYMWVADLPGLSYALTGGAVKTQSSSSQGYGHYRINIPSGGSVTLGGIRATRIRVHYLANQPATTMTIDGGSPITIPNVSDADGLGVFEVSGLADEMHTVVVNGPTSGSCYLSGIEFLRSDVGIPVHRFGWSGKVAADCFGWAAPAGTALGNLSAAAKDRQVVSVTKRANLGLAVLMFDANDANIGYPTYGLTPTQVQTNIQQLVDKIKTLSPETDVLLVTGPEKDPASFTQPYTQAEYAQAYANVAAASANVAHLDLLATWGTYAEGNARGLYYDTIHPTLYGHADIGNTLYRTLMPRDYNLPEF